MENQNHTNTANLTLPQVEESPTITEKNLNLEVFLVRSENSWVEVLAHAEEQVGVVDLV